MKIKRIIIIAIVVLLVIIGAVIGINYYRNSNRLTINEKKWIDQNHSTNKVININVLNNAYVFGYNGSGVFYDFLNDFSTKYGLNINEVTYNYGTNPSDVSLSLKTSTTDNDIVLYKDHYVLLSKEYKIINDVKDLNNKKVGILSSDNNYVTSFLTGEGINLTAYENIDGLLASFEENDYVIVPLHLYLGNILSGNYKIIYHFSDIYMYYVLTLNNDELSSVLKKYYNVWNDKLDDYYNKNLFNLMTSSLKITSTDIDAMHSKTYEYGYINNSPYEVISNGSYGGIAAIYLKGFIDFADVEFNFTKYSNFNKFAKAISKDKVDIYFNYNNLTNEFNKTEFGINAYASIIANSKNDIVFNSFNSLKGKTVYVSKNSILNTYLTNLNNVNIKTYENAKELVKLNKKDAIIFIDQNIFEYYQNHGLDNYTVRYTGPLNTNYSFNVKSDKNSALYKLLNEYMNITDSHQVLNKGIYNHEKTIETGLILSLIAKYFMYFLVIGLVLGFIIIRKTKKITVAKKIKKEDKMRFIDQLTLLKNRNYLKENIDKWSNNTIYPQAVLVIDLNHLQHINDIEGYEEGDKQIKAAANALIKTQLDNSDIIRTDGNEFVIYMVGYSQKQITNYIHKLNKEFKKLPYKYGAEFGYSMIIDDIKTIEDALNEATKALKEQKELNEK